MEIVSPLPVIGILAAGLTSLATAIWGQTAKNRAIFGITGSIIAFLSVVAMIPGALKGTIYAVTLIKFLPGISIKFRADSLGLLFAIVSSSMWVLVNIYTIGYMDHEEHKHRFFAFFALAIFAALGIALSENLVNLFLFYEILTLSTYPLVVHAGTKEAYKAGIKYLVYTLTGGGFLLAGIVITYFLTGTLSLSQPGILASANATPALLRTLFFFFLIGFGVKAGIMPMHHWLPSAMVAPTPVSTLLHAVAVVKAGVFGILRTVYFIFGVDLMKQLGLGWILATFAAVTILAASIIAIRQDHLKRRLAYSTISQLSYIVFAAALLSPAATIAAFIHIAAHAFSKGTLFMCAGMITHETGKTNVSQMKGLANRMPVTMAMFSIAAFSMIGAPPLAGFVTKWFLGQGALQANQPYLVLVLIFSAVLNMAYFLPIIYTAYFDKPGEEIEPVENLPRETSPYMLWPVVGTATMTFILGIFAGLPGLPMSIAKLASTIFFKG